MAAERQRLRRVLGRFKKDELPGAVRWLGRKEEASKRRSKKDIISSTLDACAENKVSEHAITELELQYILAHPNSVQWKAYTLKYANVWVPSMADTDPQTFCKRFQLYLGDLDYDMVEALQSPYHWLALRVCERGRLPYTCHLVRCPLSPCILLAGVRKPHLSWILDALCLTIECSEWRDTELSGKNLHSLLDMLLNQASQGPYSAYRLNQKDRNPLLAARRKRHRLHQECHRESDEQRKRHKAAEDIFGTNLLPKLEKFTFKLEAPLSADRDDQIRCSVKLAGSSVLQGVKRCIVSDLISLPVPSTLTTLYSSGSNCVLVQRGCVEHSVSDSRLVDETENESTDNG